MRTGGIGRRRWVRYLCAGLVALVSVATAAALRRPDAPAPALWAPAAQAALDPAIGHDGAHTTLAASASPEDLAIRFQALLGQHAVLAADLMRSRIRGDDDFVQAANAALGQNTNDMTALIGQLFGADTGKKFRPMWSEHIVELFAYAGALANQDNAAKASALGELQEYEGDLAQFFAGASHGRLPLPAARAAIALHVQHLTQQADAYAAHDYVNADELYRQGFEHTYDLGLTLDNALLPAADRAALQQPVWRLRSQLGKLLAEHAVLIEDVTRAAVTNTPDFAAAGQMINANTGDIAGAIDTLFGPAAAKQFQSMWGKHVEQLVAYAAATATKDTAKQQQAKAALQSFERGMAAFLNGATAKRMTTPALTAALQAHDTMLLKHADAYGARDYQTAHTVAYTTYDDMFELAKQLADAFGATVAAKLPHGGAQTGFGGEAPLVENR